MKNIRLLRIFADIPIISFFCTVAILFNSCEDIEYPEEPTNVGINNHGFIANGIRMVKKNGFEIDNSISSIFDTSVNIAGDFTLKASLNSKNEDKSLKYPSAAITWYTFEMANDVDLPKEYPFIGFYSSQPIDSSKCYIRLYYSESEGAFGIYDNVISGSVIFTKYDSICSGIFNLIIACDDDTVYINDGKFDYEIRQY